MEHERVHEIDLMRFLAALMVVFFHYAFRGYAGGDHLEMPYPLLAPVAKYGYLGVELFFMISGFVILMTASGSTLRRFAISRFVRLYPAFWACCTITFLAILVLGGDHFRATLGQYLVNMTMLSGFVHVPSIDGVYWSLFIELQFYALIAALLAIGQIHRAELCLGLWLLATALVETLWPLAQLRSLLITPYSAFFIAGATCYLIRTQGMTLARAGLLSMAWLMAVYLSTRGLHSFEQRFHADISPFLVGAIVTAFFLAMLAVALRRTGAIGRRQWIALGALTYPLYLLHQNIGYMLINAGYPRINAHLLFWGMIALMLALSYAVHAGIERPVSRPLKAALSALFDYPTRISRALLTRRGQPLP